MTSLTDNSLVMTSGQNATVTLKFYGRWSDLNNLTSESLTVTADAPHQERGRAEFALTVTPAGLGLRQQRPADRADPVAPDGRRRARRGKG